MMVFQEYPSAFFAGIEVNEETLLAGLQWFLLEKFQKGHF